MVFKTPKLPEAPQPVVPTTAAAEIDRSVEEERRRQARKRGRMANILSSDYAGGSDSASKALGA